jgi:DNA-directed RNA polymerase beta subunit
MEGLRLDQPFFYSLLRAHEDVHNYATDTLEHFNFFLTKRLAPMVKQTCGCNVTIPPSDKGFPVTKRHVVTFLNMNIQRPTIPKTEGVSRGIRVTQVDGEPMFPHEALIRGLTYTAGIFVSLRHEIFSGEGDDEVLESSTDFHNVFFFNMPIPVGCIACNTVDPKLRTSAVAHLDPLDKGGYWVIRGMVKVIQPQKVQRNNILLVRRVVKGAESWMEANIRSIRADEKFRSTSTLKVYLATSGLITIDIPYLKANQNVLVAFRLLGVHDRDDIQRFVFQEGDAGAHVEAARRLLMASFATPSGVAALAWTEDELVSHMGSVLPNAKTCDPVKLRRMVTQQVNGELLPHCGFDDADKTKFKKALFLGLICKRLLFVHLGVEDEDDRDFEGFKNLQMCSTTLTMLMRQLFAEFSKTLRRRVFDRVRDGKNVDPDSIILHADNMPKLASAFTDGEVTVQKDASNSGKEVIQLVQQVNPLSLQSHMGRINTPLPKSGKYPQCRNIDTSQLFSVCPVKTPEGEGAGLLQNLTIMSRVRVPIDMEDLEPLLLALPGIKPLESTGTLVLLNSDPIGRTDDPESLLETIRDARREPDGGLPTSITVVFTPIGLLVTSDIGVITFPLLHVPSLDRLAVAVAEAELGGVNLWTTLCNHGIVEYVDPWEALDMTVAFKLEDIRKSATPEAPFGMFTHLAPHPTCFLSTAAGTIPFANHNQAPRNTYQCVDPREPVIVKGRGIVPLGSVAVNDEVLGYDMHSRARFNRVVHVQRAPRDRPCVQVWTTGTRTVFCTHDHLVFTQRGWMHASTLATMRDPDPDNYVDKVLVLINPFSTAVKWEDVEYVIDCDEMTELCDITVADASQSFFCGRNGFMLVHNSSMAEQAISAPCLTVLDRHEMNYRHVLWYPQTPVCTTHIAEVKGLNSWPMGSNAILAIAPFFSSEDSITFCQASEDLGMMRVSVMRSFRCVAKKHGTDTEVFEHPTLTEGSSTKCVGIRGECDYSKIGKDGLPLPGTWVQNNDVIIGRTGKRHEVGPDGELRELRSDRSVVLHCDPSEKHIVDTVIVSMNKDGSRLVRVTTRSTRRLQCGDKVSSGTVPRFRGGWHGAGEDVAGSGARATAQHPSHFSHNPCQIHLFAAFLPSRPKRNGRNDASA